MPVKDLSIYLLLIWMPWWSLNLKGRYALIISISSPGFNIQQDETVLTVGIMDLTVLDTSNDGLPISLLSLTPSQVSVRGLTEKACNRLSSLFSPQASDLCSSFGSHHNLFQR